MPKALAVYGFRRRPTPPMLTISTAIAAPLLPEICSLATMPHLYLPRHTADAVGQEALHAAKRAQRHAPLSRSLASPDMMMMRLLNFTTQKAKDELSFIAMPRNSRHALNTRYRSSVSRSLGNAGFYASRQAKPLAKIMSKLNAERH